MTNEDIEAKTGASLFHIGHLLYRILETLEDLRDLKQSEMDSRR
jgi:hypothetical protein